MKPNNDYFGTVRQAQKPDHPGRWLRVLIIILALVVVAIVMIIGYYIFQISTPVSRSDEQKIVEIKDGSSTEQIAATLKSAGLIRDARSFMIYVKTGPAHGLLKPGPYAFKPNMNTVQIVDYLHSGKIAVKTITFPEGITIDQMAARYEKIGFGSSQEFVAATKEIYDYDFLKFRPAGATLEGYLFPDTYTLKINATSRDLINKMLETFGQKAWPILQSAKKSNYKSYQLLTMSSIVEAEGLTIKDRALIASALFNRLERGMKLESDVTISYVTGSKQVSPADLAINSPYNSYKAAGLPPGPICNPGLAAISATVNPTPSDYLYFLADKGGVVHFAKTYAEHQNNISEYLQ